MRVGAAFGWIGVAIAVPLCAHALMERAVQTTLVDSLEQASGEVVTVSDVELSLFGALRLEDLRVGDIARVESVEARLSLGALIGGRLQTAEVVVAGPRVDVRENGSRLRRVVKRLTRRNGLVTSEGSGAIAKSWPKIHVRDGLLHADAGERGSVRVADFSARPIARGLRLLAAETNVETSLAGEAIAVSFGRSAADFDFASARIIRAIATGGTATLGRLGDVTGAELSFGVEKPGITRFVGRVGAGKLSVKVGGTTTELSIASVDAARLNPLLTTSRFTAGRVSGNLGIARSGENAATLTGSLLLGKVRGTVPWLFSSELDLSAELAGSARIDWGTGHSISIHDLHVRRGPAIARLSGSLAKPGAKLDSVRGTLAFRLEEIACSELAGAMPAELVKPLRGIRMGGTLQGGVTLTLGKPGKRSVELDVDIDPKACRVLSDAPASDVGLLARGYEHLLPSGRRVVLSAGQPGYVGLRALPRHVTNAFIVAEDGRFFRHHGFDSRQIESSIAKDLAVGRFARGGSTISQQLAKNLYLTRERTVGRKLQEAVLAWRIEAVLDKRQILERYLNIIQLSDTVYGVDGAAKRWFGKTASTLTPREAAFLASLTRAPSTTTAQIADQGGLTPRMVRRVEHILKSMHAFGAIDAPTLASARRARLKLRPLVASR